MAYAPAALTPHNPNVTLLLSFRFRKMSKARKPSLPDVRTDAQTPETRMLKRGLKGETNEENQSSVRGRSIQMFAGVKKRKR